MARPLAVRQSFAELFSVAEVNIREDQLQQVQAFYSHFDVETPEELIGARQWDFEEGPWPTGPKGVKVKALIRRALELANSPANSLHLRTPTTPVLSEPDPTADASQRHGFDPLDQFPQQDAPAHAGSEASQHVAPEPERSPGPRAGSELALCAFGASQLSTPASARSGRPVLGEYPSVPFIPEERDDKPIVKRKHRD